MQHACKGACPMVIKRGGPKLMLPPFLESQNIILIMNIHGNTWQLPEMKSYILFEIGKLKVTV